ncbi:S10 family serine carboxypeptidase-like protein [Nannocystis pusilla]|uniref:S10 family serine carboxypeptidase-like protein n=1 Tax=Nannocystis pusilla TaxID=889268 RepID=UPI003B77B122
MLLFNGGPGVSTGLILAGNTAPQTLGDDLEPVPSPAPWTALGHLLYIDARNTGFSQQSIADPSQMGLRSAELNSRNFNSYLDAADFARALLRFWGDHPALAGRRLVLVGESYGGIRASILLHMLLFPARYEQGPGRYRDPALAAAIAAHLAARFPGDEPPAPTSSPASSATSSSSSPAWPAPPSRRAPETCSKRQVLRFMSSRTASASSSSPAPPSRTRATRGPTSSTSSRTPAAAATTSPAPAPGSATCSRAPAPACRAATPSPQSCRSRPRPSTASPPPTGRPPSACATSATTRPTTPTSPITSAPCRRGTATSCPSRSRPSTASAARPRSWPASTRATRTTAACSSTTSPTPASSSPTPPATSRCGALDRPHPRAVQERRRRRRARRRPAAGQRAARRAARPVPPRRLRRRARPRPAHDPSGPVRRLHAVTYDRPVELRADVAAWLAEAP